MGASLTHHTTYTITIDDIGVSLTVDGPAFCPDDPDTIRWAPRKEGGWNIGWLCQDDFFSGADYWADRDSGEFREFDNQVERDEFLTEAILDHDDKHVFIVEKYEHGLVHYSPIGTQWYPDRQWDVAPCAVLVVPDDATEPEEYAKAVLQEYSDWCNGAVYGVVLRSVDVNGNIIDDENEEVWGFIGYEYAQSEVDGAVKNGCL